MALVQFMLNRNSQNYPAIPKLTVDGVFGAATEESVRAFQSIFDLASDGVVGPATWYQLVLLYVAVQRLSELRSLGQTYTRYNWELPEPLSVGDTGSRVTFLQYVLSVLAAFIPSIPAADITGTYTENTQESVRAFQDYAGLSPTGSIDDTTWNALYAQYAGIRQEVLSDGELFPITQTDAPEATPVFASDTPAAPPASIFPQPPTGEAAQRYSDTSRFLQYPAGGFAPGQQDKEGPL
ncbi:MAG: peptidoglycan-binding protein [Oscillospiraceae bacterium]